jgi:Fic family protein
LDEVVLACFMRALEGAESQLRDVMIEAQFWRRHREITLNEPQWLMVNRLLDGFEGKFTSSKWARIAKCSSDTALRDIDDLVAKDILQGDAAGGRSTSYSLVGLSDERAAMAGC